MSVSLNHYFFLQGNVSGGSSKVISDRVRHKRLPWGGGGCANIKRNGPVDTQIHSKTSTTTLY